MTESTMGFFAKILLQMISFGVILLVGYFYPGFLASVLSGLDNMLAAAAQNAEPSGTLRLILQFAGAGFALLMGTLVILIGWALWGIFSKRFLKWRREFFAWRRIMMASLIPIFAHAVKWGLALKWPAGLSYLGNISEWLINQLGAGLQGQLDAFGASGHLTTFIIGLTLMMLWGVLVFLFRRILRRTGKTRSSLNPQRSKDMEIEAEVKYEPGVQLGPIVSILVFGVSTFLLASFIPLVLYGFVILPLNPEYFGTFSMWVLIAGSLTLLLMMPMWAFYEKRTVANNYVVPLKFADGLLNVHIKTGTHFVPLYPLLSTNRDNVTGEPVRGTLEENPGPEDKGVVFVGGVTVHLDNEGNDNPDPKMHAVAFDKAKVKVRPTLTYTCNNPLQRLSRNSPIKDLNEASRDAMRGIISGLPTSRQANDMPGVLSALLDGQRAYFVRTRTSNAGSGVHGGDLVTHKATGQVMITLGGKDWDDTIAQALRAQVLADGNPAMLDAACEGNTKDRSTIIVDSIYAADKLKKALLENGYEFTGLPRIGEIELPERITNAAAQAAAEVEERNAALSTAETMKQSAVVMKGAGLDGKDAAWAAWARENPEAGKVIILAGSDKSNVIVNSN